MAFVVPGVGVYNAGAGLATAFAASSPVVLIAGQVNRDGIGKRPRPAPRDRRPARPRAPDHRVAATGARRDRDPRAPCTRRSARCSAAAGNRSRSRCRRRRSPRRPTSRCSSRPTTSAVPADPDQIEAAARVLGDGRATVDLGRRRRRARRREPARSPPWPSSCRRRSSPPDRARAPSTTATRSSVGTVWVNRRMQPLLDDADVIARRRHPLPRQQGAWPRRRSCTSTSTRPRSAATSPEPDRGRGRRGADARRCCSSSVRKRRDPRRSRDAPRSCTRSASRSRTHAPRRRAPGRDGRPAARRDPRRRRARALHHHHRLHEPHALPGVRAAHLPLDVVHGHPRLGLPRRPRREGGSARRAGGVRHRRRRLPVRRRPSSPPRCSTASTPSPWSTTTTPTATPTATSASGSAAARSAPTLRNPDFVQVRRVVRRRRGANWPKGADIGPALREALGNDRPTVIEVPMDRLPSPF